MTTNSEPCAACARLRTALEGLAAQWKEAGRRVRPLESARITQEKRERAKEWMFYTNRANELKAVLAIPDDGAESLTQEEKKDLKA